MLFARKWPRFTRNLGGNLLEVTPPLRLIPPTGGPFACSIPPVLPTACAARLRAAPQRLPETESFWSGEVFSLGAIFIRIKIVGSLGCLKLTLSSKKALVCLPSANGVYGKQKRQVSSHKNELTSASGSWPHLTQWEAREHQFLNQSVCASLDLLEKTGPRAAALKDEKRRPKSDQTKTRKNRNQPDRSSRFS